MYISSMSFRLYLNLLWIRQQFVGQVLLIYGLYKRDLAKICKFRVIAI